MYNFNEILEYNNKQLKRINARKVDNLLKQKNDITIYCLPNKLNYKNAFVNGFFEVEKNKYNNYYDCINTINEIKYYNLSNECGNNLVYYIEI